jgi:hypothetical protein
MSILLSIKSVPSSKLSGLGNRLEIKSNGLAFNPVADIVNITGTSVTLQPDTAYRIYATSHSVTINANPPEAGKWAYEGHIELFVAGTGYVVTGANVVLANPLEPDAVNNCTVRFHDGIAIIAVEDHVAGYIVVNGSTSGEGSLAYGIAISTNDYVAFAVSLNGTTIPLAGAVANGEKHVVGNGYAETTLTGAVNCGTSKFTVANLTLDNVQVTGGTLTLGDAYIPSGSTVAVSGGRLGVEKVVGTGSESVINLGGTNVVIPSATPAYVSGLQITGGSAATGGAFYGSGTTGDVRFESCVITGNVASTGGGIACTKPVYLSNCIVSGNTRTGAQGRDIYPLSSIAPVVLLGGNKIGEITVTNGAKVYLSGSNTVDSIVQRAGSASRQGYVTIYSGAIVDLTGNTIATPIKPGLGVIVEGGCQVITSAGTTVSIAGGTYTKINNDGTTE